jgi:hypothetical protein
MLFDNNRKEGEIMKVQFYKNSSTSNTLDKSISGNKQIDATFNRDDHLDVMNPIIIFKMTSDVKDIIKYNYCYIPDLKRYYYIDKISTEGGLVKMECRVDVLMSFRQDIKASKQYVIRSQKRNPSPYLEDNMLPIKSKHNYKSIAFGDEVDNKICGYVILATAGDGGTVV